MSIHSSALLCSIQATKFGNSRKDRKVTNEVTNNNNAVVGSAKVTKELLPNNLLLKEITATDSKLRDLLHTFALPWDNANWLLPTRHYIAFKQAADILIEQRETLVDKFCAEYPQFVSAARASLGSMYNALDYPHPADVRSMFSLSLSFSPVPSAGDFRVDVSTDTVEMLKADWLAETNARLQRVQGETWARIAAVAEALVDRLADPDEDSKASKTGTKIFRDTLVTNAQELVGMLDGFNFAGDPDLTLVAQRLDNTLKDITADQLRHNTALRHEVHQASQTVLDTANDFLDRMAF